MDNNNDLTLKSYNDHVQDYVQGTPQQIDGDYKTWINKTLKLIPSNGTILEIGSASGRDADYMKAKGYKVIATDATAAFVDLLNKAGHKAHLLNALTDDFGTGYDLIFANAVFLHFSPTQTATVLDKAFKSLKVGGIVAFSLKQGSGDSWSKSKINAPRHFYYWNKPSLQQLLAETDFELIELSSYIGHNDKWLHVIAKKPRS